MDMAAERSRDGLTGVRDEENRLGWPPIASALENESMRRWRLLDGPVGPLVVVKTPPGRAPHTKGHVAAELARLGYLNPITPAYRCGHLERSAACRRPRCGWVA